MIQNFMFYIKSKKEVQDMFEFPEITEALETTNVFEKTERSSGQYGSSMDWTGDCCYGD